MYLLRATGRACTSLAWFNSIWTLAILTLSLAALRIPPSYLMLLSSSVGLLFVFEFGQEYLVHSCRPPVANTSPAANYWPVLTVRCSSISDQTYMFLYESVCCWGFLLSAFTPVKTKGNSDFSRDTLNAQPPWQLYCAPNCLKTNKKKPAFPSAGVRKKNTFFYGKKNT